MNETTYYLHLEDESGESIVSKKITESFYKEMDREFKYEGEYYYLWEWDEDWDEGCDQLVNISTYRKVYEPTSDYTEIINSMEDMYKRRNS